MNVHAYMQKKKKFTCQTFYLWRKRERERERERERSHDHHVDGGNMNNINGKQRDSHVT